jgi:hypothetical protein
LAGIGLPVMLPFEADWIVNGLMINAVIKSVLTTATVIIMGLFII